MNQNNYLDNQVNNIFELDKIYPTHKQSLCISIDDIHKHKIYGTINMEKFLNLDNILVYDDRVNLNLNLEPKYKFINYSNNIRSICYHCMNVDISNLPNNLIIFDACCCLLTDLDMINLPSNLVELHCFGNNITQLDNLPLNLMELKCGNNNITQLDNLPLGLKKICCEDNKITYLDLLPETLEYLDCSHNKILNLDNLPNGLVYLECSYNLICKLDSLPDSLEQVFAKSNKIDSISKLPKKLTRANFTSNPLISTPKCSNSLLLLNYSLDAEKASQTDKVIQSGYKIAYGSYHVAKYTTYGVGVGLLGIGLLTLYPFLKAYKKIKK